MREITNKDLENFCREVCGDQRGTPWEESTEKKIADMKAKLQEALSNGRVFVMTMYSNPSPNRSIH